MPTDLPTEVFRILRDEFFDVDGKSKQFTVRVKLGTQDDPVDEYISRVLSERLPKDIKVAKAPGPLTSPDMVVYRPALCGRVSNKELVENTTKIFGFEVKKLERPFNSPKSVGRASGMDYNSTPPCGMIKIFDSTGADINIRGFYLFVIMEKILEVALKQAPENHIDAVITSLVLCDGYILNEDFEYYSSIVGQRTKSIRLGTFGDGVNRNRPMIIFGNPLGVTLLDHAATLIHKEDRLQDEETGIAKIGTLSRTRVTTQDKASFSCYRVTQDVTKDFKIFDVVDPFKAAVSREQTQGRGKFKINSITIV